jgi:hypothetical protein
MGWEPDPLCEKPGPNRLNHGGAFNVIGLPKAGRLGNVDLQTHSPVNDVDQCLNESAKTESFLVRILADFYYFVI